METVRKSYYLEGGHFYCGMTAEKNGNIWINKNGVLILNLKFEIFNQILMLNF